MSLGLFLGLCMHVVCMYGLMANGSLIGREERERERERESNTANFSRASRDTESDLLAILIRLEQKRAPCNAN